MAENKQDIWEVISSVLDKNPSLEEKELFEKWMSENSINPKVFDVLTRLGYTGDIEHMKASKAGIYEKIMSKAGAERQKKKVYLIRYLTVASVALLLGLGAWFYVRSFVSGKEVLAEMKVPYGEQAKIVLSDGTIVRLNSGSYLRYPSKFKGKERVVMLEGEAYFEVAKDKNHPFIVAADVLNIKVLGTHFNVKAYADEGRVTTTLIEGAIRISEVRTGSSGKDITVSPDQQVIFNKSSGGFQTQKVDASLYAGWTKGQYYFDRDSLSFIVKQLERNYNIKISIRSGFLKSQLFSGSASKDDNIFQILDMMKNYRSFTYKAYKDSIVLFEREL